MAHNFGSMPVLPEIRLETPQPEWHDELVTRSMRQLVISYVMAD